MLELFNFSNFSTFSGAYSWVVAHGYILIFAAMLIEGPIVTVAAAFASAFGVFNVFLIFVLSFFGDIVADVIYYAVGRFGRLTLIERFGRYLGLSADRMHRIEDLLNRHAVKTLLALKLTPVLPTPGLMIVGASRMPLRKFAMICSFIILPRTIFLVFMGYYFGAAYEMFALRFKQNLVTLIIILALAALVYYVFTKILERLAKRIENI